MARDVALGTLDFNDALQRLARRETIAKLMQRHDLSKALASQIALGHADLEQVLFRRQFKEYREAHRSKTCLVDGARLQLFCCGGVLRAGEIVSAGPYEVTWSEGEGGASAEVHKLEIKYALEAGMETERTASGSSPRPTPHRPERRPQDRYHCSDLRLYTLIREEREVRVALLEGEKFHGRIQWFSRYELGLLKSTGGQVVIFRHAVTRLQAVESKKGV